MGPGFTRGIGFSSSILMSGGRERLDKLEALGGTWSCIAILSKFRTT